MWTRLTQGSSENGSAAKCEIAPAERQRLRAKWSIINSTLAANDVIIYSPPEQPGPTRRTISYAYAGGCFSIAGAGRDIQVHKRGRYHRHAPANVDGGCQSYNTNDAAPNWRITPARTSLRLTAKYLWEHVDRVDEIPA